MVRSLSRRAFLGGSLAVGATGLLAACGGGASSGQGGGSGSWSFKDDTGNTVNLDRRPTRIAGLNDTIASLWNYGIVPVASFGATALADDVNFEGKDTSKVTEVGNTYGQIDVEALAAQRPDVIVTHAYPVDTSGKLDPAKPLYGFNDLEQQKLVGEVAPIVAIAMAGPATKVIERTVDLATSLGVTEETLAEPRRKYEAARERLRKVAGSGLSVMAVAAYPSEGVHIAKAKDDPALRSYVDLGLSYPDPGGSDYYWRSVSWENITDYRTDVVLYSLRAMDGEAMLDQPTFAQLPAAKAGQVYPWEFSSMDYVAQARTIDNLAANLEKARKVS
ncbi:ABC transporter substrate-binding protein [Saccharomonospora xinjiangensis]|uniref:ABC-type Fe3+-hydroxamate transport system, periplasmic component n=1 Tax=Saccharomonospora xinjiangensis XJ-54 TaxID=882086 RepID=I0V4V8_9PSEU|nr:ABC transporter substrate-binding protein [Saccharomonospora xinjiangensis]EID55161.1 ABC-type Fe3+-hydroxamate transport system, periplasmic component [Saccharomonospora xinjiangensis XJ-54]